MAIQLQGNGGVVAEVDGTTFRAIRVTARPVNYGSLGMYRLGMHSGVMAAALAANAEIYQFRWTDATNFALVFRVSISAGGPQIAATGAVLSWSLMMAVARAWSVIGSGGTRAVMTGNINKLRTSMGTSLVNDAGIATTAGLTAGTKTIDHATSNMGTVTGAFSTGAITVQTVANMLPHTDLFNAVYGGSHPLVLAGTGGGEGFIIRNGTVNFPAAATWVFSVTSEWAEAAAF